MIKKMEEKRTTKTTIIKDYRRLNNQLRRETDRAKEVYIKEICEEIMDLQKKGRYDIVYQKAQKLGGRTSKAIRMFGIEDNQGNIVADHRQTLRIWEKYIQEANRQLSDAATYRLLPDDPTDTYNQDLLSFLQTVGPTQDLSSLDISFLHIPNPCTPTLYFLPKIHKTNNPGRPIVRF